MRVAIAFLLFDMIFHSLAELTPYPRWLKEEFHTRPLPARLPTHQEIDDLLVQGKEGESSPLVEDIMETCDSLWEYGKPWPPSKGRANLDSPGQYAKFAFCWLASRLDLYEGIVGVPQRWNMFTNGVKRVKLARSRLRFADGSWCDVRQWADPEDLTHYSHWFQEKTLSYELFVRASDADSSKGYCNFLAHQHARNAKGFPLLSIYIYEARYRYPDPEEDAGEVLRQQNGPPAWDQDGPIWAYDVANRRLKSLEGTEEQMKVRQLFSKN